jgi:2-methylcitrate dehydratase
MTTILNTVTNNLLPILLPEFILGAYGSNGRHQGSGIFKGDWMSCVENLAAFVCRSAYEDLSEATREQLKIRILDSLGCAVAACEGLPVQSIRRYLAEFGSHGGCTLIGGGTATPDSATLYNGTLVRYLDLNDAYIAKGETCHPSDNLAPILAGAEYADLSGGMS